MTAVSVTPDDEISMTEAKEAWSEAAYQILKEVAGGYNKTITYKDLAAQVQAASNIEKAVPMRQWIGEVLDSVAIKNLDKGEPITTALSVSSTTGSVSYGYVAAATKHYGEAPQNVDQHAAEERLKCYQFFEAKNLPENGGFVTLTPQVARRKKLQAAKAAREFRRPTCPACFMQLPRTGVCDHCD